VREALEVTPRTALQHALTGHALAPHSAFYKFDIPYTVTHSAQIPAPVLVAESPAGSFFLDFVSGGYTGGKADPTLLVGMSDTQLYVRNSGTGGKMLARKLPRAFAYPVTLDYMSGTGGRILGPLTHARTVSLAVAPSDSNAAAVTGWASVDENAGPEEVFVTGDGGLSWSDVTGNLREATGVVGKVGVPVVV
jgi:hypothetical protein